MVVQIGPSGTVTDEAPCEMWVSRPLDRAMQQCLRYRSVLGPPALAPPNLGGIVFYTGVIR